MDITYFANYRIPTEKAHGLQIMKSCEAFAKAGHSVRLVAAPAGKKFKDDPFMYYGVERNFEISLFWLPDLFLLPERWAFYVRSVLHTLFLTLRHWRQRHQGMFYAREYIPLYALSLGGFRYIAEIHDYRSGRPRGWIRNSLERAQAIIVNSSGTKVALQEHYDIPDEKVLVVPNGIDAEFFAVPESPNQAREKLNIPQKRTVIGYIGRLETVGREKGVPELLDALRLARRERDDILLYVVGGPDHLVDKYRRESEGLPITFTGQVRYRDIPLYMRAMDALVLPLPQGRHARTTSPIKLFEYMAAGKPIIASDLPSLRRVLNEDNAFLFDTDDLESMTQEILRAIGDEAEAAARSAQALRDVKQFSWAARAKQIITFIS